MAATLAAAGENPVTKKRIIDACESVRRVLAVMATAGLYDDSGKWLYHTGLPAKSGVGGGLIAVSPGKFGIAVVSPPLDDAGNSVRAQRAIADISNALGGNPYVAERGQLKGDTMRHASKGGHRRPPAVSAGVAGRAAGAYPMTLTLNAQTKDGATTVTSTVTISSIGSWKRAGGTRVTRRDLKENGYPGA